MGFDAEPVFPLVTAFDRLTLAIGLFPPSLTVPHAM